jgi:hypothetical protein
MLAGLLSPSPASSSVVGAARTLAALYPDGRPVLTRRVNSPAEAADPPPRGLRDVVVDLGHLNESAADGGVAVRFVSTTAADGSTSRRAIVEVTGTKNWDLRPGMHRAITDIGTNLRAVAGAPTAYAVGVVQAMRDAGIKPGEPVMLVGHSQGGMVAAEVAAGLAGSSQFHITHLVTAGSPIGHIALPPSVQTLSLENRQDIVPLVDGRDNPRTSTQLTVGVDEGSPVDAAGFGARHDLLSAYAPGAADVEASSDPSIRDWLDGADGFFGGDAVRTVSYDVHRHR